MSSMKMDYVVRDPVHGLIPFTEQEKKIMALWPVQRLRGVRQLASAYLVYPGALHTRFDHSLGTMHIAWKLCQQVCPRNRSAQKMVRLAGLLHDIGHGPFSHVTEVVLEKHSPLFQKRRESKKTTHEYISRMLVQSWPGIVSELGGEYTTVAGLIDPEVAKDDRTYQHDAIAGPLDADKIDYILRDAHFTGVKYGSFDCDWLISSARLAPEIAGHQRLAYHIGSELAAEQLVIGRYYMTSQVYAHRVRCISDLMLIRAVDLAIADCDPAMIRLFAVNHVDHAFLQEYMQWDDARLLRHLCANGSGGARDLSRRLLDRRLYKQVFDEVSLDRGISSTGKWYVLQLEKQYEAKNAFAYETAVAELYGVSPWQVIMDVRHTQRPGRLGPRQDDDEVIFVDSKGNRAEPTRGILKNESEKPDWMHGEKKVSFYVKADSEEEVRRMKRQRNKVIRKLREVYEGVRKGA